MNTTRETKEIILFDGECNLCNTFVNFVIDRDYKKRFLFTSLQSQKGIAIQNKAGIGTQDMYSVILYNPENNSYKEKSSAILHILKHFKGLWQLSTLAFAVPPYIRNVLYNWVARNRYKWFGKNSCRLPDPELKKRFI